MQRKIDFFLKVYCHGKVFQLKWVRSIIVITSNLSFPAEQLTPEEEEKKRIRRERNKMAAAKCRNRRRELTDTLQAVS